MNGRQLAALSGMIGSVLFFAIFMVEGWLRPGYSAREMFVSELSLGLRGWIQIANFVVSGLLFLVFARGVAPALQTGSAARAGPILLAIIGGSFVASGIFVMDPVTTPPDEMSLSGRLHVAFGAVVFMLMPVTCFVFWRRFRADARWQSLQVNGLPSWPMAWWTLAVSMVTLVALILMIVGPAEPDAPPNAFNTWIGAIQRAALIPYLLWQFTFAFQLFKLGQE
jgi:hypothetical protein